MASRTPTLPDDEKQDSLYNPGEQITQEKMGAGYTGAGIDQLESFANDPDNASNKVDEQEKNGTTPPDTNFRSTYGGKKTPGGKVLTGFNVRAILKKRGPIGLIVAIGLGGGLVGTLLFSPGILLVQMKEMLVDRFNYQLAAMETRSDLIMNRKISSQMTSGVCTNIASIRCKFSTISEKQAARFKAAGIEIEDGSQKFGNRIKPGNLRWNDEVISAKDFRAKFNSDPNFRAAMRKVYNPRFAGFADQVWAKVAAKIGITKARALPDGDDAAKAQAIQDQAKNGTTISSIPDDGIDCPTGNGPCTRDGTALSEAESDAARAAKAAAAEGLEQAGEAAAREAADSIAEVSEVAGDVTSASVNSIANFLKITGGADMACQAYTAVRGLGYAAKTVRALQLARYAMVFLNTADQIKEGTAKPEDVAYLGGILTSVAYDVKSGAQRKAAMDSFGMQYATYGTMGGYNNSYISQFMAGGGLTGDLISITSWIDAQLGGTPRTSCAFLANGWVQLGSAGVGILLLLIPGVNVVIGAADVAKAGLSVAVSVALAVLPGLLKDIVAGTVTEGLVGEDAGNAVASGSSTMMSQLSGARGGAPLTVEQAVAYQGVQDQVIAQYAEEEQATLSPLDPTSRNTFMGSIISQLIPYSGAASSGATALSTIPKFLSSSFASLIPTTAAQTTEELETAFTSCTDPDSADYLKIATDPFCNPVFGIPTEYLSRDPISVAEDLINSNQITEEGAVVSGSAYEIFITNCINRERPLGDTGEAADGHDGMECKIDSQTKANYYLYHIDTSVDEGMDGYAEEGGNAGGESKQALAKKIVAKNKVTYWTGNGGVYPKLEDIANGTVDPDALPCGINIYILKIIDKITDKYPVFITDINRGCEATIPGGVSIPKGSSKGSAHYRGNGSAIDIDSANGRPTNGRDAMSIEIINLIMPILTEAAAAGQGWSAIGQSTCAGGSITLGTGVRQFADGCNHLHIQVPPASDKTLEIGT
jgi:hypothetical protein